MMTEALTLIVQPECDGMRLDQFLAKAYPDYSRTYFAQLIEEKQILVNGRATKKREQVSSGNTITLEFPPREPTHLVPENIPLEILYEDEYLVVINKPQGLVVHPGAGNQSGTLANGILYHMGAYEQDSLRPGIVHRLDKDTSGVMVIAKKEAIHRALVKQFMERTTEKRYLAIIVGEAKVQEIVAPIARDPIHRTRMCVNMEKGKIAISRVTNLETKVIKSEKISLVSVELITGRTHQIRVHMKHQNTPVLGDPLYGSTKVNNNFGIDKQLLHAFELAFSHPITGKRLLFRANPGENLDRFIKDHFPEKISWLLSDKS